MFDAKTIMTTDVITVGRKTPVYDAVEILLENGVTGLPVVEEILEALICLFRRSKASKHPHRPEPASVHGWMHTTGERIFAWHTQIL